MASIYINVALWHVQHGDKVRACIMIRKALAEANKTGDKRMAGLLLAALSFGRR